MNPQKINLVLFDLGGVLIELTGIRPMWCGQASHQTEEQLWETWLTNKTVSLMDRGKLTTEEFCRRWIEEQSLNISVDEFSQIYESLYVGLFEGARELIENVRQKTSIGCLSNCNPCHWPLFKASGITDSMDYIFTSHEIGYAKPEDAIYQHVIQETPFDPQNILFIDDNAINVTAAQRNGFLAEKAKGLEEVKKVLKKIGLSSN